MSDDVLDEPGGPTPITRPRGECGKVRYPSEHAAKRSIRGQDTKGRAQRWKGRLGTYFCKPCRSWHVGHTGG